MAAKTAKGGVRKSKPVPSKTSLRSPYEKIWTPVVGEDMQFILQTLLDKFKKLGLKKMETQTKKDKKSKKTKPSDGNNNNNTVKKVTTEAPKEEAGPATEAPKVETGPTTGVPKEESPMVEEAAPKSGWSHADLRQQLAIGINEVTRALEKNDLYLVIVCKSAKPEMMTKHIIELSYSREVPACQLPRLSENMAPALGLNSVLALGFRKSSDVFREQVEAILPRVPRLHVPWLKTGDLESKTVSEEDVEEEDDSVNPTASRKRKLSPAKESADMTLQELRVKKIVPNPNKKRKVKVKKSLAKK